MYKSFKEMPIWQMAMAVGEDIYNITTGLPKKEDYGFTSQIRRAALSISANVAEEKEEAKVEVKKEEDVS